MMTLQNAQATKKKKIFPSIPIGRIFPSDGVKPDILRGDSERSTKLEEK